MALNNLTRNSATPHIPTIPATPKVPETPKVPAPTVPATPKVPDTPKRPTHGSRHPAIILFMLAAFFASGVRAQTSYEVDDGSGGGSAREPSIAVSPDGTLASAWLGYNVDDLSSTGIYIRSSTNNGAFWSISKAMLGTHSVTNDEKLAYRTPGSNGSGSPELVMIFHSYDFGGEDLLVNYSSDNGQDWGSATSVESNAYHYTHAERAQIVVDRNYSNGYDAHQNYTYLTWTDDVGPNGGSNSVKFATIPQGNHDTPTPITIETPVAGDTVSVCGIAVADDHYGTVYVLWCARDRTESFYLDKSTDAGATWTKGTSAIPVETGIKEPSKFDDGNYGDYPALTISEPTCHDAGNENVFVAYTAGPSDTTNNPSDMFLASAVLTDLTHWTTTNINADNVVEGSDGNTHHYTYQFDPTLAPDGYGGVFLLYYTAQDNGSPIVPCAVIYEADPHWQNRSLTPSPYGYTFNHIVHDYIDIAWDAGRGVAHAVWTDFIPSGGYQGILTQAISNAPIGGGNAIPPVGDLGFSNQRRIVMTGNTGHLVGFGQLTPSTTVNKNYANWYSEQTSNGDGTSTNWTDPKEIDTHDFDNYTNTSGMNDAADANGMTPSVGVYERGGTSDQKGYRAVAAVWTAQPPQRGYVEDEAFLYIRVKEYDANGCEAGDLSDWSPVDSISITSPSEWGTISPVVAPLTAQVLGSLKERYLIGWIITYAHFGYLQSVTYLRGQNHGPEGPSPSYVMTRNEDWGPHKGSWSAVSTLVDNFLWPYSEYILMDGNHHSHGSFISVTSNESNGNGTGNSLDLSEEVVFTGDGTLVYSGVWDVNPSYVTVASPTLGAIGTNLGEAIGTTPGGPYTSYTASLLNFGLFPQLTLYYNDGSYIRSGYSYPFGSFQRNPSVTITSTGQKIVAWEDMNYAFVGPTQLFTSAIVMRKTQVDGTWNLIQDVTSASATDLTWTWLLNPSLTAFPKTTLTDAPGGTGGTDQDPGAAELLYWQQNNTNSVGTTYALHERQFFEGKGSPHWDGSWTIRDPIGGSPAWPLDGTSGIPGANAQRSFGVYNTGPQYHSIPGNTNLYHDAGSGLYINGLSYGIGNEVQPAGGGAMTILPTIARSTADIGALKGTFDTALGVQLYRSEARIKGSSMVTFKWGKVYVEDTALGEPFREVMLHDGIPDSDIFVSHDAMRDSIFATEWFDWPVSAEIKYDRFMLIPSAGIITYSIDTGVFYDSVGGSHFVYDTVPSTFAPDTTRRTDSAFFAPGTQMMYTIQLVHQDGHIDTMETAIYNPSVGTFISPKTVHIDNAGFAGDTVMLRVLGNFNNIPDADSNVRFARETMLDTYPSYGDTTIAIGTYGGIVPTPDSCFVADGPFSNPSNPGANDVSMLVHFCGIGLPITAQVYDNLGNPVGPPSIYTSDGQTWDRLPITAPGTPGTYFVHVTVGSYSNTSGYSVY